MMKEEDKHGRTTIFGCFLARQLQVSQNPNLLTCHNVLSLNFFIIVE